MSGFKIIERTGGNYVTDLTKEKATLSGLDCSSIDLTQNGNSYSGENGEYSINFVVANKVAKGTLSGPKPSEVLPSSKIGDEGPDPDEDLETFSADVSFWDPPLTNTLKLLWSIVRERIPTGLRKPRRIEE